MKLKKLRPLVESVLAENVPARNSDWLLFKIVCEKLGIDVHNVSVEEMCNRHNDLNFPSFESVRRTRQKIQAEGMYKPSDDVKFYRNKQENEYRKEFGNAV